MSGLIIDPNLHGWTTAPLIDYDSRYLVTHYTAGGGYGERVSAWGNNAPGPYQHEYDLTTDSPGVGYNQPTYTSSNVFYNGVPVIGPASNSTINSGTGLSKSSLKQILQPYTIYAVVEYVQNRTSYYANLAISGSSNEVQFWARVSDGVWGIQSGANGCISSSDSMNASTKTILCCVVNGASSSLCINNSNILLTGNAGSLDLSSKLTILGPATGMSGTFGAAYYVRWMLFEGAHNSSQRGNIFNMLRLTYGVVSRLPYVSIDKNCIYTIDSNNILSQVVDPHYNITWGNSNSIYQPYQNSWSSGNTYIRHNDSIHSGQFLIISPNTIPTWALNWAGPATYAVVEYCDPYNYGNGSYDAFSSGSSGQFAMQFYFIYHNIGDARCIVYASGSNSYSLSSYGAGYHSFIVTTPGAGRTGKLYIDGVQVMTFTTDLSASIPITNSCSLNYGSSSNPSVQQGPYLYRVELTSAEVSALHNDFVSKRA